MTKLHIGCGRYHLEGWVNIDIREIKGVDVICDITQGLPFEEESVDLIFSEHVFEHFTIEKQAQAYFDLMEQILGKV